MNGTRVKELKYTTNMMSIHENNVRVDWVHFLKAKFLCIEWNALIFKTLYICMRSGKCHMTVNMILIFFFKGTEKAVTFGNDPLLYTLLRCSYLLIHYFCLDWTDRCSLKHLEQNKKANKSKIPDLKKFLVPLH